MSKAAQLAALIGSQSALSNRNIIINGAMQVAQRGTSFTGLGGSAGVYSLDRIRYGFTMNSGRFTITQSTDSPDGFANSLKVDITTAESSLNASSGAALSQLLEGQNVQFFAKGTSDAKQYALSFYVKSNVTGTYIVELFDNDNTRQVSKSYTIDSANTWERKTISFPADTTGAFGNDNANSLFVQWFLASGTDRTSGTLNTSWASSTNANRAVGQTNLFSSTSNEWYITGVQLEVGEQATPFEHRSFADELFSCQRYYSHAVTCIGPASSGSLIQAFASFPKQMRASPSYSASGALNFSDGYAADFVQSSGAVAIVANAAPDGSPAQFLNFTNFSGLSAGEIMFFPRNSANNNRIIADAEL